MSWVDRFVADFEARNGAFASRHSPVQIYCLTEGWGQPVKIGATSDLVARMQSIQSMTWREMHLAWVVNGSLLLELALKRALWSRVARGEWFCDRDNYIKRLLDGGERCIRCAADKAVADLGECAWRRPIALGVPSLLRPKTSEGAAP